MIILAIDPGNVESAYVVLDHGEIGQFGKVPNADLLQIVKGIQALHYPYSVGLIIEMVASYGMPVGQTVFDTCVWIGRFTEAFGSAEYVFRSTVRTHHCHSTKANDSNVRQAVIDIYGGKAKAIGRKKTPGPLYGISADVWQALALALYWQDTHAREGEIICA